MSNSVFRIAALVFILGIFLPGSAFAADEPLCFEGETQKFTFRWEYDPVGKKRIMLLRRPGFGESFSMMSIFNCQVQRDNGSLTVSFKGKQFETVRFPESGPATISLQGNDAFTNVPASACASAAGTTES